MKKFNDLFFISFLSLILIGCQNNNLSLTEEITSIEVYERDSETLVTTIEDDEFINDLVRELNGAKTYSSSTTNFDFELPDYELVFKNDTDKEVFRIGYFAEVVNLGVKGRYLDVGEDIMYQVELQLPFILSGGNVSWLKN